jgi:hypothetical protein
MTIDALATDSSLVLISRLLGSDRQCCCDLAVTLIVGLVCRCAIL